MGGHSSISSVNTTWNPEVSYAVKLKQTFEPRKAKMQTPVIRQKKKSRAGFAAKAVPLGCKQPAPKSLPKVSAAPAGAAAKPVRLLLERFPDSDRKRVCLGLYAPEAKAVFVAGTFNGWQPSATPLQRQDDGRWVAEFQIEQGRHEYRFIVDGQWTDDPMSSDYVPNPFGGLNCVLATDLRT
jgi:hypothetical protein